MKVGVACGSKVLFARICHCPRIGGYGVVNKKPCDKNDLCLLKLLNAKYTIAQLPTGPGAFMLLP
jgi:hypothetical protein